MENQILTPNELRFRLQALYSVIDEGLTIYLALGYHIPQNAYFYTLECTSF
jgi:hypothetical protein